MVNLVAAICFMQLAVLEGTVCYVVKIIIFLWYTGFMSVHGIHLFCSCSSSFSCIFQMSSALGLPTITSDTISSRLSDILPTLKEITVEFKDPVRNHYLADEQTKILASK